MAAEYNKLSNGLLITNICRHHDDMTELEGLLDWNCTV